MVGLGQSLKELGGDDMGRVSRALHVKIFCDVCTTCKGSGVPITEIRNDDIA